MNELDNQSLMIRSRHESPIIGIIGATNPSEGYGANESFRLGYNLRELIDNKGSLFTGGVGGVGLDFYYGVADYCRERNVADKFFLLFPDMNNIQPPKDYFDLAKRTSNELLVVEKAGKDMTERREIVARVADLLVVINGGMGTVDEAVMGLELNKPLLCLTNSGGAAEVLSRVKSGEIPIDDGVNKELIIPYNSVTDMTEGIREIINKGALK